MATNDITTPVGGDFQYYSAWGGTSFSFKVCAKHDAVLALAHSLPEQGEQKHPIYEIHLGIHENCSSSIQKNNAQLTCEKTPNILNEYQFREFWIKWSDKVIKVGYEIAVEEFLSYKASDLPHQINYIGIRTSENATGKWIFKKIWIPDSNGHVPPNAVKGGYETGETLYIARARYEGNFIPGKLQPSLRACILGVVSTSNYAEIAADDYEVLCADIGKWVEVRKGKIPKNAILAGKIENSDLFIGRFTYKCALTSGSVNPVSGKCTIAYKGDLQQSKDYEIYVSN